MSRSDTSVRMGASATIGLGSVLAVVMSWTANQAFIWAVIHGLLGWFYVIYYLIFRDGWTWL